MRKNHIDQKVIIDMNNLETFNYPSPKEKYKVFVRCFTYNHREYIGDALNGFAMQQTDFPFVCFVMDDASPDGEQEVIKSWMERECDMSKAEFIDIPTSQVVIVPHKSNLSCTFAFYLLKQNLHGTGDKKMNHVYPWRRVCEYEAMCEGDDYWTDSLKLQKQVDILDKNPNISICCHNAIVHRESDKSEYPFVTDIKEGVIPMKTLIIHSWFTPTASFVYRIKNVDLSLLPSGINGDMFMLFTSASKGNVYFMKEYYSIYRYNTVYGTSSSATTTPIQLHIKKINLMNYIDKITKKKYLIYTYQKRFECYKGILYNILIKIIRSFSNK